MVLARFLPRDEQFFGHFDDAAANAAEVARVLVEVVAQGQDVERQVRRLRDLEHRGDEITHNVFNALNSTFVTPSTARTSGTSQLSWTTSSTVSRRPAGDCGCTASASRPSRRASWSAS